MDQARLKGASPSIFSVVKYSTIAEAQTSTQQGLCGKTPRSFTRKSFSWSNFLKKNGPKIPLEVGLAYSGLQEELS